MIKNEKGMTLVELIVVMALMTVVMTILINMMLMLNRVEVLNRDKGDAIRIVKAVQSYLVGELTFASLIQVGDSLEDPKANVIFAENGRVKLNENILFGNDFYGRVQINFTAAVLKDTLMRIEIEAFIRDELIEQSVVVIENMSKNIINSEIQDFTATGDHISRIYFIR